MQKCQLSREIRDITVMNATLSFWNLAVRVFDKKKYQFQLIKFVSQFTFSKEKILLGIKIRLFLPRVNEIQYCIAVVLVGYGDFYTYQCCFCK